MWFSYHIFDGEKNLEELWIVSQQIYLRSLWIFKCNFQNKDLRYYGAFTVLHKNTQTNKQKTLVCLDHLFSWKLPYRKKYSYNISVTEVISWYKRKKISNSLTIFLTNGLDKLYLHVKGYCGKISFFLDQVAWKSLK